MTGLDCAEAVAVFLAEKHAGYKLHDEKVKDNELLTVCGFLPRPRSETEARRNFPYIVVRPLGTTDYETESLSGGVSYIDIRIYFSTYCEDAKNGFVEIYHLVEKSRQQLLKNRTLAGKYRLNLTKDTPLRTEVLEEQPAPSVWLGFIELQYEIMNLIEEGTFDDIFR